MSMLNRKLKFTVKFSSGNDAINEYVSNAETFFSTREQAKFEYLIQSEDVKRCVNEFRCDADFYEMVFVIMCSNIKKYVDVENFSSAICKQWCSEAEKNKYLQCLIPESSNISPSAYNFYDSAKVSEFAFGTIPNLKTFGQDYRFCLNSFSSILCSFSHLQRHFVLYVSNTHKPECTSSGEMGHKIFVEYDMLIRILVNTSPQQKAAELFFHLEYPPFIKVSHKNHGSNVSETDNTIISARVSKAKEMEYSSEKFERAFELGCSCNNTFCTSKRLGKHLVLKLMIEDKFQARYIVEQLILRCSKKTEISFSFLDTVRIVGNRSELKNFPWPPVNKWQKNISANDKFSCDYAWKAVHSRSAVVFDQILLNEQNVNNQNYWKELKIKLLNYAYKNPSALAKALFYISDMIERGVIFVFKTTLERKFSYFCHFVELNKLPEGMCYVRRVLITPSRIVFLQPYEHFDNRIIRKFGEEFIIRISVQDDNFSKLTYAVQYNSQKEKVMEKVVSHVLKSGLIGSRHYEVLASSSSQLREHGLWMYAKDLDKNTASSIRDWMGDFSSITNVAKYMARMGQCFSSTEEGVQITLKNENELFLEDIKTRNGRYIFSDGIGTLSSSLANEINSSLCKKSGTDAERLHYKPSAFQIRYKGCKGMIAEDPRIKGHFIGIRPSMKKFECTTSNLLEIVKTSAPRKLFLNKHLITILEQMGIAKESFMDLQADMMINLLDSLTNEKLAVSLLVHELNTVFPFKDLQASGISITNEPFFRSLILALFKTFAENIRSKVRIAIPEKYGRNMLGVLDETMTLKYGQVFVQYSESTSAPNSRLKVLTGNVVVTKNPSLHPGDVRKLKAIDVPHLHHIKDCIVFPACGKRPHPDEMAGADLDGDEFVVLWYKPLIFNRQNEKPMDYPVYSEDSKLDNIQVSDMVDFFCHYIENDCIGTFAHAHLVWADKLKNGIFSRKCMDIARRYPYVLDFAKHGSIEYLKKSDRPDQYPDFMQKGLNGNSYHSKKALGSLYRASRVLDACSSKINLLTESSSYDIKLEYPGWEKYEKSAENHKQNYTNRVIEILDKYGLKSEAEAFSGYVELEACKKWKQENSNAVKIIKAYIFNIMLTFRNIFLNEVTKEIEELNLNEEMRKRAKFQRASAWYMVLYGKRAERVLSFPWVLSDVLAEVRKNNISDENISLNCLEDIDADITQCVSSGILNYNTAANLKCMCLNLSEAILFQWLSNSGLNIWTNENKSCCESCCQRIICYFQTRSGKYCCSASNKDLSMCSHACSASKLLLEFLKFFVKKTEDDIGQCTDSCDGFLPRNLQELSLQTLAYFSVTRNIHYFGLDFDTANLAKHAICTKTDDIFETEGDPIKIPVKSELLKDLIENYMDDIKIYLKKNSGVKNVILRPERDLFNNLCLIVNSIGKNWQRWNLQEIVLDPDFTEKLKKNVSVV